MTDVVADGPATGPGGLGRAALAWDEMFSEPGSPRAAWKPLYDEFQRLSGEEIRSRSDALARTYLDQGVTFDLGGVERPFPVDLLPRVIAAPEWDTVEKGVEQRVRALEAFLADCYGPRRAVADGVLPLSAILSSAHFHREAHGIEPANGVRVHVSGIDLIRDEQGAFRVLEDNVRVPSGVSYVLANRRAVSQLLPGPFAALGVRPVADYPYQLLQALRAASTVPDPTVVVLSPGVYNSAYFEHTLLARTMGVQLVEGRDLLCHDGRVWMRTTTGERRVDVIYRRVDDEFIDPVHFRADSLLGCPGLLTAARAGHVSIANAIGNGVADDKLIYTYIPDLIRYYLAEEPVLGNVDTWRLEDPGALEEVLDRLDELVVKPVDGSGGKGLVIGPRATRPELDALRERLIADPRGWIAQPVVQLSTVPTVIGSELKPRHVDLRPFAVNDGDRIWVLPGGLTRVALPEGELVVNSSQGGGAKDTWVLRRDGARPRERVGTSTSSHRVVVPASGPDPGPDGGGAAEQQMQQQQSLAAPTGFGRQEQDPAAVEPVAGGQRRSDRPQDQPC